MVCPKSLAVNFPPNFDLPLDVRGALLVLDSIAADVAARRRGVVAGTRGPLRGQDARLPANSQAAHRIDRGSQHVQGLHGGRDGREEVNLSSRTQNNNKRLQGFIGLCGRTSKG